MTRKIILYLAILLLSGCAASYRPINPPTINYTSHTLNDGISFSYKYDVLNEKRNRKYYRKEYSRRIKVVAVKITNNTNEAINIGTDVTFHCGYKQVQLMEPRVIKNYIKQSSASYLFYLLLTPLKLNIFNETDVKTYSIGYVIGPGLAFGNMAVAGNANTILQKELYEYDITHRIIEPNETVYGIIGLRDVGYDPISVRLVNKPSQALDVTSQPIDEITEEIKTEEPALVNSILELNSNLYKTDSSLTYEDYYNRIIVFTVHPGIEFIRKSQENYSNGSIKSVGLEAKHKLDKSDDLYATMTNYYKIGTWRYFYENGQLRVLVDYNINEQKDGRYIEYDEQGNIVKETTYKSGKKIE